MQKDLTKEILELIRFTSSDLSEDIETKLRSSIEIEEPGSAAKGALETIITNIELARGNSTPLCQDTGTPIFYAHYPEGWSTRKIRKQIVAATQQATSLSYLRPNAVDAISGINTGDNSGDDHYPTIHFNEIDGDILTFDLMLKGGGCENVGAQYRLPDNKLNAGRDLEGVRNVVLDAVHNAQGKGCAPGVLGVAIGGDRGSSFVASKEVLFHQLDDTNSNPQLAQLENQITRDANQLGIGPMGFGGKTTVLGTKIKGLHRIPASFFVSVSYMCWAYRRRRMVFDGESIQYQ